jgi:Domain of unknown function (DUF4126)
MDVASGREVLTAVALAVALAATTGLRAWLPLLLAGLLARLGVLHLAGPFDFVASNRALLLFAVATAIEIAADKIPALDHALDAVSTLVRPAAGALLAASALGTVTDPLTAIVLGVVVGAPSSLIPHAAKSAVRAVSTAMTAGLGNPVLSLAEDLLVVCLVLLAVFLPLLVLAGLLLTGLLVARRLRRPRAAAGVA